MAGYQDKVIGNIPSNVVSGISARVKKIIWKKIREGNKIMLNKSTNGWGLIQSYSLVILCVSVTNFIVSKFGMPLWKARFTYIWIWDVFIVGLLLIMAFQRENVLVTERVKGKVLRFVLSSIVRLGMAYLLYVNITCVTVPLSIDTYYMVRGGKLIERVLEVESVMEGPYSVIYRSIFFVKETQTYDQYFALARKPKNGEKVKIFFLKRSRIILETEFLS